MKHFTPCENLLALRKEIDDFDQRLASMLCERLRLIHRAAPLKPTRHDIRLEARIEEIIAKIRPVADRYGVDPDYLEKIYRYLIEESISSEAHQWEILNQNSHSE